MSYGDNNRFDHSSTEYGAFILELCYIKYFFFKGMV